MGQKLCEVLRLTNLRTNPKCQPGAFGMTSDKFESKISMAKVVPIILAGGRGTRLWPISRKLAPKQFVHFAAHRTLFQETLLRVRDPEYYEAPVIITNEDLRFFAVEQARELGVSLGAVLLEPIARNTAAAIATATALVIQMFGANAIVQVVASDLYVEADCVYLDSVQKARDASAAGYLVTFGIAPTEPATGYSYLQLGELLSDKVYMVDRFVEKPSRETAETLLSAGDFLWNSGMLMYSAADFMEELLKYAPLISEAATKAVTKATTATGFTRLGVERFSICPDMSVDQAVLQKSKKIAVVLSTFVWSDMGSWDAVWKAGPKDDQRNLNRGATTFLNTTNSLAITSGPHITVEGIDGLAVISCNDTIYVCHLQESQQVSQMVNKLRSAPATRSLTEELSSHQVGARTISKCDEDRLRVRHFSIMPGESLHFERYDRCNLHWIVVAGTVEVALRSSTRIIGENESLAFRSGQLRRATNRGNVLLEVIEIEIV